MSNYPHLTATCASDPKPDGCSDMVEPGHAFCGYCLSLLGRLKSFRDNDEYAERKAVSGRVIA